MALSSDIVSQFVKATSDDTPKKVEATVYGKIVKDGDTKYVRIDGSEILTPVESETAIEDGDRVSIKIKDHTAIVTGNLTSPSTNDERVSSQISEFEVIVADKVSTKDFDAEKGRIDDLVSKNVTITEQLNADSASISSLSADNVAIHGMLNANSANITDLQTSTLKATDAELKYATIENLNATDATVRNLQADYGKFNKLTTDDLSAIHATIGTLDATFATVDLANIKDGAIKTAMIDNSAIGSAQIADGSITDAKIVGLTANKITAGKLDAAEIEVVNLNAANITVGTINGQQIAPGAIDFDKLGTSLGTTITNASSNASNAITTANDTKAHSIFSVDVMYALGNSEATEPTTGWSTTAPPWESGKYMWQKTVTTYGDKTQEESESTCITGAVGQNGNDGAQGPKGDKGDKGATGPQGATGKSIGSIVNYYLATTLSTGVTSSTSGWTTTVQNVTATNKYLWNYEVIKYTDGTVASTSTPCVIGAYGDKGATGATGSTGSIGATGNGISGITEHYQVSASNSTAPTSWVTTVPTLTATNKYLWNYETISYTNNTTKDTIKRVIGVYGDKGATGNGVKTIQEQYYLSTSNTTQTGGSWQTTQPAWANGKYIWTRSHITWSDNTTTDTTPILADAINKANTTAVNASSTASTASSNASTALSTANSASSKADSATSTANAAKTAAATAQTTANGKNTVYYSTAAPSGGTYKTNDIWFDTDDGNRIYSWSGSAWVTKQFGANAIADLAITNAKIADGTIQNGKIANLDAGKITAGTLSADRIGANTITAAKIAANTITAAKIAAGTITATQIAAKTIIGDKLVASTITGDKIAAKTITANNMVANTITAASGIIADLAVTNAKIADATIESAKIKSIDAAKITSGYIDAARINTGTITIGKLDTSTQTTISTASSNASSAVTTASSALSTANTAKLLTEVETISSNMKKFKNVCGYTYDSGDITGMLLIITPITPVQMVQLHIKGYNYGYAKETIDLEIGFQNYAGGFYATGFINKGSFPITSVSVAKVSTSDTRAVIYIGTASTVWSRPKIIVDEVITGYSTAPDSYKDGFSATITTTKSYTTQAVTISGKDTFALSVGADAAIAEWCYSNNRTYINGSKIYTGTITATQIAANAITADKISTNALKSRNYVANSTGSYLDLSNGAFDSKNLKWDSTGNISIGGNATFSTGSGKTAIAIKPGVVDLGTSAKFVLHGMDDEGDVTCTPLSFDTYTDSMSGNVNLIANMQATQINLIGSSFPSKWGDGVTTNCSMYIGGSLGVKGEINTFGYSINVGSVELRSQAPYIDFHFNNSTADFSTRISQTKEGWLNVFATAGLRVVSNYGSGCVLQGRDNNSHTYGCFWNGVLQFCVDNSNIGGVSDIRLKKDISQIEDKYMNAIASIDLKQFRMDYKPYGNEIMYGAIAQELESALIAQGVSITENQLLTTFKNDGDPNTYFKINYEQFLLLRLASDEKLLKQKDVQLKYIEQQLYALQFEVQQLKGGNVVC